MKVYVVRTSMKRKELDRFEYFEVLGVFTSMKKAKESIYTGYRVDKGENVSEYNNSGTLQINYDLLSTDDVPCNYRALINEHYLNRNWML